MPTCAGVSQAAKSYLSGFCQFAKAENGKERALAGLKILSYLFVVPVLAGLAVWEAQTSSVESQENHLISEQ